MNRASSGRKVLHSVPGIIGVLLLIAALPDTVQAQASRLYTVPHCRVVDTRGPIGPYGGPALAASTSRTFGFSQCGVSPTARAVALNVTVTGSTVGGYLTLYPSGGAAPLSSTINFRTGQTRANNAIVKLGAGALLSVAAGRRGIAPGTRTSSSISSGTSTARRTTSPRAPTPARTGRSPCPPARP
jgi:hypothetical protein